MKKNVKIILCIVIIAVVLLGFVAKYQTYGLYWGMNINDYEGTAGDKDIFSNSDRLIHSVVNIYSNSFGRTVYAYSIGQYGDLNRSLFKKIGARVTHITSVRPNFADHLDFFNGRMSPRMVHTVLEQAGMPDGTEPDNLALLVRYHTMDSYTYVLRIRYSGVSEVKYVYDPDGNLLSEEAIDKLTVKILVQYLTLAAALSGILVCLLVIPKQIEKRKKKPLPNE